MGVRVHDRCVYGLMIYEYVGFMMDGHMGIRYMQASSQKFSLDDHTLAFFSPLGFMIDGHMGRIL